MRPTDLYTLGSMANLVREKKNGNQTFYNINRHIDYTNVCVLALAGLTDPRVTYWEPAKWVARLRATMTGGGPILLRTAMDAGHAGASGRYDRLDDVARQYAFASLRRGWVWSDRWLRRVRERTQFRSAGDWRIRQIG